MSTLRPFRALRPIPSLVEEVACVPYDVINSDEARELAAGKPHSFLGVVRPEVNLPEGTDEHADEVYNQGAAWLLEYAGSDKSIWEKEPSLYVYRLVMDGRAQTGVFGCVSVQDYNNDIILKHEKTRPDKEADRTRHIVTQRAHAEPVMLTFRDHAGVQSIVDHTVKVEPLYDFKAEDGVRHTIWNVERRDELVAAFKDVAALYVADGHHRCKAASLAAEQVKPAEDDEHLFFPAVLFPMGDMAILPYNRIVYSLPDGPEAFLDTLNAQCGVNPTDNPAPDKAGDVCIYLAGRWYKASLPATRRQNVADTLDVARLSEYILEPLLDIHDPRTDPNIYFVGGIRGTAELERLVDGGKAELAISMYPTSIEELLAVSDAGQLMPPKSTWFEPKLRSGLLVHLF